MEKRQGWVLGRIVGAPVVLKPSALVMVAVLTALFLPTAQALNPDLRAQAWLASFAVVVMLMLSVFLHEVAHALAAKAHGFTVHELALTLWGGHTSYSEGRSTPRSAAIIALVGPFTNVVLGALAWWAFQTQSTTTTAAMLLYVTAYANGAVALFNLLPGLPLDGGQVTESIVWAVTGSRVKGTVAAAWTGRVLAVTLVALAVGIPALRGDQVQLYTVVVAALVGSFMWSAATAALRGSKRRAKIERLDPRLLAAPAAAVDAGASAATIVDVLIRARGADGPAQARAAEVVLVSQGVPVGYVDPAALLSVPAEARAATSAWSVAVALPAVAVVDAGARGPELFAAVVAAAPFSSVCVLVEAGQVVGVLHTSDVARAVHLD